MILKITGLTLSLMKITLYTYHYGGNHVNNIMSYTTDIMSRDVITGRYYMHVPN